MSHQIHEDTFDHLPKLLKNVSYNRVNPQQSIGLGEKLLLQRDDNDLHVAAGLVLEETGHLDPKQKHQINKNRKPKEDADLESHLSNVAVVQRCIHLIQDKERSRTEADASEADSSEETPQNKRQTL